MTITTYIGGSCAVSAIGNLGDLPNALAAMESFCLEQLGRIDSKFSKNYAKLTSYYLFSAGPEVALGEKGSSHHSKDWVKYGTEFAAFITDNELGTVATLGQKLNAKHHPTTTAQVWLWSPDQKAMVAWWDKRPKSKRS